MKMPFGKHKDVELEEVPRPYLRWLRRQEWLGGWLAQAIDGVLNKEEQPVPFEWPWGTAEDGE